MAQERSLFSAVLWDRPKRTNAEEARISALYIFSKEGFGNIVTDWPEENLLGKEKCTCR